MFSRYVLKNCNIVDVFSNKEYKSDILIENGIIKDINTNIVCKIEFDCSDKIVTSTFSDGHVHFRDLLQKGSGTIESESKACIHGGFGQVLVMPNTIPPLTNMFLVEFYKRKLRKLNIDAKLVYDYRYYRIDDINKYYTNDGKDISLKDLKKFLINFINNSDIIFILHCCDVHEPSKILSAIELFSNYDIKLHITHVSKKRSVEIIRKAKEEGFNFTCDVTPHHLFLLPYDWKVNPLPNNFRDVYALIDGLLDGTIDCICSDHSPHSNFSKNGVNIIESVYNIIFKVFDGRISQKQYLSYISKNVNRVFGLEDRKIEIGKKASLVVINKKSFVKNQEKIYSKGINIPYLNNKFVNKIEKVIIGNNIYEFE